MSPCRRRADTWRLINAYGTGVGNRPRARDSAAAAQPAATPTIVSASGGIDHQADDGCGAVRWTGFALYDAGIRHYDSGDARPQGQVVGQHVDRDRRQEEQKSTTPSQNNGE